MNNRLPKKSAGNSPVKKKRAALFPLSIEKICPDFQEWPDSWKGEGKDVPFGEGLIEVFRPFIQSLIDHGWSKSTIKNHSDNLWLLGGEIIREVNDDNEYRRFTPHQKLLDAIGSEGGPYCRHLDSEEESRSFDATCRKLFKYLMEEKARPS
jgi:hypothetical protein